MKYNNNINGNEPPTFHIPLVSADLNPGWKQHQFPSDVGYMQWDKLYKKQTADTYLQVPELENCN